MTSSIGKQTIITIQILPNISRSKGNQTMKFDKFIEYNRNIFLEKSYKIQNVLEKLVSDPFLKNQYCTYLWFRSLKFYIVCFYCESKLMTIYQIMSKLRCSPFTFASCKTFFKKSGQGLVFLLHFLHCFWRKIFLMLCSVNLTKFHRIIAFTF